MVSTNTQRWPWLGIIFGTRSWQRAPQLKSLPPSTEVLIENIKRAHYQVAIWKNSDKLNPPLLDPCDYGWYRDEATRCLLPVMIPAGIKPAPPEVLKLIRCSCSSEAPCSPSSRCSCSKAQMPCSEFCNCFTHSSASCCNKWTDLLMNNNEEKVSEPSFDVKYDGEESY